MARISQQAMFDYRRVAQCWCSNWIQWIWTGTVEENIRDHKRSVWLALHLAFMEHQIVEVNCRGGAWHLWHLWLSFRNCELTVSPCFTMFHHETHLNSPTWNYRWHCPRDPTRSHEFKGFCSNTEPLRFVIACRPEAPSRGAESSPLKEEFLRRWIDGCTKWFSVKIGEYMMLFEAAWPYSLSETVTKAIQSIPHSLDKSHWSAIWTLPTWRLENAWAGPKTACVKPMESSSV